MNFSETLPIPRVYHTASLCTSGSANGMIIVYGGRSADQLSLSDIWGLRKHRNGKWDWVEAPIRSTSIKPTPRF